MYVYVIRQFTTDETLMELLIVLIELSKLIDSSKQSLKLLYMVYRHHSGERDRKLSFTYCIAVQHCMPTGQRPLVTEESSYIVRLGY